jgi:hypothetical protein
MTRHLEKADMQPSLMEHIRQTAKDDVRLFLAPFIGAVRGIKVELDRINARKAVQRKAIRRHS